MSPWWVRLTRNWRRKSLWKKQKLRLTETSGMEKISAALAADKAVMLLPNHSAHYDSAILYLALDQINQPAYFMAAWQVFQMSNSFEQWAMQKLGCFSIDREGVDRTAFKLAIDVLQNKKSPLVIFAEGDIYHTNDKLTPFREGAAAIALSAARKSEREVAVFPVGIKFWYETNPLVPLKEILGTLEERVFIRRQPKLPLVERIYRLAEGLLALKELDYIGHTRQGEVRERITLLCQEVLDGLEKRHGLSSQAIPATEVSPEREELKIPERVKQLRQEIIKQLQEPQSKSEERLLEEEMGDLFFVMQLYSYPGNYLRVNPTIERIAETVDKLEEDILSHPLPAVRGERAAHVRIGDPYLIPPGKHKLSAEALTSLWQEQVQALLDQLNSERTSSFSGE